MKNLFFALLFVGISFQTAHAQYATTPQPYPNYPVYGPYPGVTPPAYVTPIYPQPYQYLVCYAQGLVNGVYFYGTGYNTYTANQWALYACQSTGQYCRLTGCHYY